MSDSSEPIAGPSSMAAASGLPKVARARGIYVYDTSGKRYIDASGGPAVYCLGHSHPEVNAAIKAQLDRIAHGYRYSFTSEALETLRAMVARACGGGLDHAVFVCDGSEAVESCLKIALQYHVARGERSRHRFISRRRSWHGNTLGALAVSDFLERRAPFESALVPASFLGTVNPYRPPAGVAPGELAEYAARELQAEIEWLGPEQVAAFIFEPVVGAAGGVVPAPPGYAARVREVCDRYGVLMIADEVMCGSGRTGTWRALEHDDVVPDLMSIAKGLAAGYVPLGAAVYHRRLAEVIDAHDGGPMTGHTFTGHTLACAAGVAVQTVVQRDGLLERVRRDGARLRQWLVEALGELEPVGDIRGRGFFFGIEFVADRASREPFPADRRLAARIGAAAVADGLLCYPVSGNVDGRRGDCVLLAPPFNATEQELAEIVERLQAAVRRGLAAVGR